MGQDGSEGSGSGAFRLIIVALFAFLGILAVGLVAVAAIIFLRPGTEAEPTADFQTVAGTPTAGVATWTPSPPGPPTEPGATSPIVTRALTYYSRHGRVYSDAGLARMTA